MAIKTFQFAPVNSGDEIILNNKALIQADLLWTNANFAADFPAQTISLDLSGYSMVYIEFIYGYGWNFAGGKGTTGIFPKGYNRSYFAGLYSYYSVWRSVNVKDTGITFGVAAYNTNSSGSGTTNSNSALIPQTIYGIK